MPLCSKCSTEKPKDAFAVSRKNSSGIESRCRDCKNAAGKANYEANKERLQVVRAEWWKRNAKALKEERSAYRLAHPELYAVASKKWRTGNPDKVRESARSYRLKYPEKNREYSRQNRINNPDTAKVCLANWRTGGGTLTVEQWRWLIGQCGHECPRCHIQESQIKTIYPGRSDGGFEVDHVVPVCLGGKSEVLNIQPLCPACNNCKRKKAIDFRPEHLRKAIAA